MATGVVERKELNRYETKRNELRGQIENAARELGSLNEQKDGAIHERETAIKEKERILEEIKTKKEQLSALERDVLQKNKEIAQLEATHKGKMGSLSEEITNIEYRLKLLKRGAVNAKNTANEYEPTVKKYNKLLVELASVENKLKKGNSEYVKLEKSLKDISEKAKSVMEKAEKQKEINDDKFRTLQKYETSLNFYYNRLRKWFESKGLKLPVEYKSENIRNK